MTPKPTRTPERIELPGNKAYFERGAPGWFNLIYFMPNGQKVVTTGWEDERAQAFATALQSPAGEWRPIATAPKDGTSLMLFAPHHGRSIHAHNRRKEGLYYLARWQTSRWVGWPYGSSPTHWMPLPPAPTGEVK